MKQHIAIVGVAKNKKQVAKNIAGLLGMMVFDCHDYICFSNGMSLEQLAKKTSVTYAKKQVSKSIGELYDLQNMVFVSCDKPLLSVSDLQKLGENCFVFYLSDSSFGKNGANDDAQQDEIFAKLCIQADKRYRSRCDFVLDVASCTDEQILQQICNCLKTVE